MVGASFFYPLLGALKSSAALKAVSLSSFAIGSGAAANFGSESVHDGFDDGDFIGHGDPNSIEDHGGHEHHGTDDEHGEHEDHEEHGDHDEDDLDDHEHGEHEEEQ